MKFRDILACGLPLPALLLLTLAQALVAAAQTNDTLAVGDSNTEGQYEPKWVAGPKTRGTLGLVFSCVITLFLCAWTTVHVNIEPENKINRTLSRFVPIPALKKNDRIGRFLASRSIRKLGWGCVTLIVPEGAMAIATYERKTARLLRHRINDVLKKHGLLIEEGSTEGQGLLRGPGSKRHPWDMTLAYYAVMGGFALREADYDEAKRSVETESRNEKTRDGIEPAETKGATKTTTGEKSGENGENGKRPDVIPNADVPDTNKPLTLTPYGVLQLAEWKLLPPIRTEEVRDKSNANSLAKAIVFWQALWMIIQVIGRTAGHLPVTLLELHTVLHTFCAVAMYITWWNKPVDVDLPTEVRLDAEYVRRLIQGTDAPDPTNPLNTIAATPPASKEATKTTPPAAGDAIADEAALADDASSTKATNEEAEHAFLTTRAGLGKYMYRCLCGYGKSIRTDYFEVLGNAYKRLWRGRKNVKLEGLAISFVGLVYGGTHLAAWNNTFPSVPERRLWQISAALTASAYSMFVLSLWISVALEGKGTRGFRRVFSKSCGVFFGVGIFPCLLVRLYLLVESFASIRKLPIGSYELNTWSNDWPHAG